MTGLHIVATAARTPVGLLAETSAAAVRAGICRLQELPFVTLQGEPLIGAPDPRLPMDVQGRARWQPMLESVVEELRVKLGAIDLSRGGCEVLLALPLARPGFSEADAQWLVQTTAAQWHAHGVRARVAVGGHGHAGAMACVERIAAHARRPATEPAIYVVIGLDGYLHDQTLLWLEAQRRLTQPGIPSGLHPGEAAAGLVLVSESLRRHLRWPSLASVVGVGLGQEKRLRDSETGSLGEGLTEAVLRAAAGLSLPAEAADAVYCDINGERYRSEEWGLFALRAPQVMRTLEYEAPSTAWGDVGAAFGVLGAIVAVQSFARGYAPGPRALVMAGSDEGLRGALVLQGGQGR